MLLLQNLLDIYAALVLALPLHLTYRWFTKYHDAFTVYVHQITRLRSLLDAIRSDDAVHFLANLTITHCLAGSENRARDGRTATVTTTATAVKTKAVAAVKTKTVATVKTKTVAAVKTTTYCFPQEMSRRLCQMFMEARLIASITDPRSREFSNSGVYALTPKGLHVVEQFMAKNGLAKDIIARLLATQPVCKRLLHVVRRWDEDEVIISESVVHSVFRRFVGQAPNRTSADLGVSDPLHKYEQHSKGILLTEAPSKASGVGLNDSFKAFDAIDWLLDFTSLANEDEAGTMLAHFVRLGLIVLVRDKRRFGVSVKVYTAQVEDSPDAAAQVCLYPWKSCDAETHVLGLGTRYLPCERERHLPGHGGRPSSRWLGRPRRRREAQAAAASSKRWRTAYSSHEIGVFYTFCTP